MGQIITFYSGVHCQTWRVVTLQAKIPDANNAQQIALQANSVPVPDGHLHIRLQAHLNKGGATPMLEVRTIAVWLSVYLRINIIAHGPA